MTLPTFEKILLKKIKTWAESENGEFVLPWRILTDDVQSEMCLSVFESDVRRTVKRLVEEGRLEAITFMNYGIFKV